MRNVRCERKTKLFTLYFTKEANGNFWCGAIPHDDKYWSLYSKMKQRISLKDDLNWKENKHLKNFLAKADMWENFPAKGITLINKEFRHGDEDQRMDLLYLREDGALLPCEVKIGGKSKDSHGQLIRYIADLYFQNPCMEWIMEKRSEFLKKWVADEVASTVHENKFNEFIAKMKINNKFIRVLPRSGILMDEGFAPQLLKAVRYLNECCGFCIRLIEINTYISNIADIEKESFHFRVDFVDVQ